MLDHPFKTRQLFEDLGDALPIAVHVSQAVRDKLMSRICDVDLPASAKVVEIQYMDAGHGILCVLDFGPGTGGPIYMSAITHLKFDPRHPLAREIAAYQKHRTKILKRTGYAGQMVTGTLASPV